MELARFRVKFSICHHYVAEFEKKLLLLLTSSQIWLCPLLDDRWSTYPTKLKRINHVPLFLSNFQKINMVGVFHIRQVHKLIENLEGLAQAEQNLK